MFSIRKSSTELNDEKEPRLNFSSALSPEAHVEWGLYKILEFMGLHEILPAGQGQNRDKIKKDVEEYHIAYGIDYEQTDLDSLIARRPDGQALDRGKKSVCSWNTLERWTITKTGPGRKNQRKTKDTAHTWASLSTSVEEKRAAGKPHK